MIRDIHHTHHPPAERVEDRRQVDLALAGRMLGDIHHQQAVRFGRRELAVHQIVRWLGVRSRRVQPRSMRRWIPATPACRISRSTRLREQRIPSPKDQFGVDAR